MGAQRLGLAQHHRAGVALDVGIGDPRIALLHQRLDRVAARLDLVLLMEGPEVEADDLRAASAARPIRTGRQAGLIAWRSQSRAARAPRVFRASSNWRRFQRLRPACSRRCSTGITITGAPSHCSAATAACGEAVQRVVTGAGCGTTARRQAAVEADRGDAVDAGPGEHGRARAPRVGRGGDVEVAHRRLVRPGHRHDPVDEDAAFCSASSSSCSQARSTAATQACLAGTASGATARCTASASSSRPSSITPTSAARSREPAPWAGYAVPGDVGLADDGDHLRGARQERRGGFALGSNSIPSALVT
jgi:hypothetical protein